MGVVVVQLLVTYIKLPVVVEGGPRQTAFIASEQTRDWFIAGRLDAHLTS